MKIKTEIEINEQDFVDIITTAIEGGIGYWAEFDEVFFPDGIDENLCFSEKIGLSIFRYKDFSLPVYDCEEDSLITPLGFINYNNCIKAFEIMSTDYKVSLNNILDENYDAGDVDTFFQIAVMGVVVFG